MPATVTIANSRYSLSYPDRDYPSFTRCYRVSDKRRIWHLTRQKPPLSDISEAMDILKNCKVVGESGILDSVLFVRQNNLPPELRSQLMKIPYFSEFGQVLAFCLRVYFLRLNSMELPSSPEEHRECSRILCPGIPITRPEDSVDNRVSYSFGKEELENFLGNYYPLAGKIILLGLTGSAGQLVSPDELQETIGNNLEILEKQDQGSL